MYLLRRYAFLVSYNRIICTTKAGDAMEMAIALERNQINSPYDKYPEQWFLVFKDLFLRNKILR